MTYGFGSVISRAFKYANTAFPKFSSWFWIVLFTTLFMGGTILVSIGVTLLATSAFLIVPELYQLIGGSFFDLETEITNNMGMIMGASGVFLFIIGIVLAVFFFFFVMGFAVRACKGKDLTLAHPWAMFGQGFFGLIISIVYFLPAAIISFLLCLGPMVNTAYFVICGIIIPIILFIVSYFFYVTALVRYAKTGKLGSAFHIRTIGRIISSAGWLRYFGFILLFVIIICAVTILFNLVPVIGTLMLIFALPFFIVFQGGFFSELYDCGDKYLDVKIE